ncbi:hypothetical protein CEXT_783851 [Caerostris extrusa]|uniref:Uncharacterized protein n=1 Tax=Caerostris extrusa TaxID=172846 RepID=A0AAV4NUH5_CAEEX|nr:hypothetical protein CEXT_783851 [Caerostris extrusa]
MSKFEQRVALQTIYGDDSVKNAAGANLGNTISDFFFPLPTPQKLGRGKIYPLFFPTSSSGSTCRQDEMLSVLSAEATISSQDMPPPARWIDLLHQCGIEEGRRTV